jgi:hypothetical protein
MNELPEDLRLILRSESHDYCSVWLDDPDPDEPMPML